MPALVSAQPAPHVPGRETGQSTGPDGRFPKRLVVGITSPQTCLVLTGRLAALREAGFEVTLVSSPGPLLDQTAATEGVAARAIPIHREIAPLADLVALFRLSLLLFRLRPALTDFSTPKAGLLGNLAAVIAGVPRRIYFLRGLKLETATGFKRTLLLAAERLAAACAQVVLCNSDSLRSQAMLLGVAPADKLRVLGDGSSNGVDTEVFSPGDTPVRAELGIPLDDPVLGFVGRLTRDKGIPELFAAFEQLLFVEPKAWLLLVGWFDRAEDALDDALRLAIERHPRVRIVAAPVSALTVPYYRAMDLLVLPTLREGFPNAILEAASCGLPVIATQSTGARDAVLPEVTGLLVPPGYADAIEEAVLELLRDAEKRARMGRAARAWVLEKYSQQRVLALTVDFYRQFVE